MPIYEYICSECNKEMSIIQKFDDPAPSCFCKEGDPPVMKRVLSKGGFILKGKGWARDGYSK